MHLLRRIVRVHVNPADPPDATPRDGHGFAGVPAPRGLPRYYEFEVCCAGSPDPATDYLIDIKDIDRAARDALVPPLNRACRDQPEAEPAAIMGPMLGSLAAALPVRLHTLTWRLSPYHAIEMAPDRASTALVRQRFDFAAAHRLHRPELSDAENRRLYGKCNNAAGHGHNYRLEPCVELDLSGEHAPPPLSAAEIERITDETIITRFDHTHLNEDTAEFGLPEGANPSVENIARVFYELLAPVIESAARGRARLREVTVWETDRTCATFPAAPPGAPDA